MVEEFDVVVIGGGPSGATVGRLLAEWGYSVLILCRPLSSQPAMAESLPPSSRKLFEHLGILDQVDKAGFYRSLSSRIEVLVKAIRWAVNSRMQVVNLSLGTDRSEHEKVLSEIVHFASQRGTIIVSAYQNEGVRYLPGSLLGVLPVLLDWNCPRSEYRPKVLSQGRVAFCTSGYPIDIPGVPPSKNLKGISFSVAHMTGFVARILMDQPNISFQNLSRTLVKHSVSSEPFRAQD